MSAYYNEIDPFCAEWLRNLMAAGLIPRGDVDERSIEDVEPGDLEGYAQCHFFAGIGGWPHALRLAGWPDGRPVWTGSCPCQPLSSAGKRKGHADERHLWPAFHRLVAERRPAVVLGEQVASPLGREWLAAVRADLEELGYACGAAGLPAAGLGAPHIRERLFWVADAQSGERRLSDGQERPPLPQSPGAGEAGELGDATFRGSGAHNGKSRQSCEQQKQAGRSSISVWSAAEWLACSDGKARPVEPVAQQMADGLPESLGRLRSSQITEIEKEILSATGQGDTRKAVHDVWCALRTEALCERSVGRPVGVHEARFLLAFLRQLTEQGWAFSEGVSRARSEAEEIALRSVWWNESTARTSCGRRLDEHPDLVRLLSSILARHAQTAWGEAFNANARATFPLAAGVPGRVGRLRAYGNAIVPQVAAEFIAAVGECL